MSGVDPELTWIGIGLEDKAEFVGDLLKADGMNYTVLSSGNRGMEPMPPPRRL